MPSQALARYTSIADAVALLFHPYAEVVIHDILSDQVFYIANPLTINNDIEFLMIFIEIISYTNIRISTSVNKLKCLCCMVYRQPR